MASAAAMQTRIQTRRTSRDYDPELERFIGCGEAMLGARGTLAGVIGQCERGSVGGSGTLDGAGSYIHPYTDEQLGFGRVVRGDVEWHRWMNSVWQALTDRTKTVLLYRYQPPRAELRSDEGYGARDRYVEGSDGATGKHGPTRTGVESLLGELAGLAFALTEHPGPLLLACKEPDPTQTRKGLVVVNRSLQAQRANLVAKASRAAELESVAAHKEWFESKAGADPMRKDRERVGRTA